MSARFMMPVKFDWEFELDCWDMLEDEWSPSPSEDIWKKFDCLAPEYSSLDEFWAEIETEVGSTTWTSSKREIRHHDCMWAGHCLSKEHRASRTTTDMNTVKRGVTNNANNGTSNNANINNGNSEKECAKPTAASGAQPIKRTGVIVQRTVGRSLLLNRSNPQPQQQPQPKTETPPERPETPQSLSESEDETTVKQEDDTYWERTRGVAASEVTGQVRRGPPSSPPTPAPTPSPSQQHFINPVTSLTSASPNSNRNPVQFDHNYDTKTNVRVDDLGVQTPSDSEEEEIDVVSVRGVGTGLGTNPNRGTRQDSETVAATGKLLSAASEAVSRRLRGGPRNKRKEEEEEDDRDEEYLPRKRARKHHHYHHHFHHQTALRSPRKPNRFSTDSETDTTEKRSLHNNMERMRRIDLRNLFEDLRQLVPTLEDSSRAAKVTILKEAANYCFELTGIGKSLHSQVAALRKEQEKLRSNLSRLRRHLAARR